MKKGIKILLLVGACSLLAGSLYANSAEIGSSNDPLVTKSYVDQQVAQIKNASNSANMTSFEAEMALQRLELEMLKREFETLKTNASSTYEVVTIPVGKSILGKQGSEIIVRAGEGVAIGSSGGGLQNMTQGQDIQDGSLVPKYHLLIIPREDGRGLFARTELIVMVRGGYTIQ